MALHKFYTSVLLFSFCCLFPFQDVFGSHIMGADLTYTCNGNNSYTITLRLYRDCCGIGISGPASIQVYNGCTNTVLSTISLPQQPGSGVEVSELCPAQLPFSACASASNCPANGQTTFPGVQSFTYSSTVTLPSACSQWYFRYSDCCRNASITNGSSNAGFGIQALVNNTIDPATGSPYCNTSVAFSTQPVPFVCLNSSITFNNGAVDANGDSLRYEMINPLNNTYQPIAFTSPWNAYYPISTSPPNNFQFSPNTGQIEFTPANQEVDVLAIKITEYKNGVVVGTTMRDIQVTVLPCNISTPTQQPITNVQNGNQVDSLSVQVCPGTPLRFDILCVDPANHSLTLTSNINTTPSAIPGATLTQIGTGSSVTARINWTPLAGDTGCHNFILTAKNDDCPINGSFTRAYSICVYTEVQLLSASPTFCGTPVQLTATGGTNYTWTPSMGPNGVSNPNIYNPTVSPTTSTMYYFTSDCGTDSVFVNAAPPFIYDAGPGGNICQNGQVNLNATTDNLYAPYQFRWDPPFSYLFDPITGVPFDTARIPNPVASPLSTTWYKCYITGTNGCTNVDSVLVNVSGSAPNIVAQAQPTLVCPGDPVQLNLVANPQSCGVNQIACQGHQVQAQAGTGTTAYPIGSPTVYPTIYGHYKPSARHQFLYLQNELIALIGSGGKIDSISFYMVPVNNILDTMKNFEIKMGCTQVSALNAYQPNLVTVFSPKSVPLGITAGWITHRLDFPYDWDGTSNLVVDVCFNNIGSPTLLNKKMQATPTSFNSVYYSSGTTLQCGATGNSPQASVNRPNTRFNMCVNDIANLPIAWTPNTGPNAPTPTNIVNPIAHPTTPVIYRADVTAANGCHSQDFIYVDVDTSLRFYAFPVDTFFCLPSPLTLTTITYGNPQPPASSYEWKNLNTNTVLGNGTSLLVSPTISTDYLCTLTGPVCTLRDTVHVVVGSNIPINMVVDSIKCFGQTNGKIKAVSSGGTPPITYNWSTGAAIDSIQNLSPGIYSVTINDSQGCSGTASVNLNQPALLSVNSSIQNILCFGNNNGNVTLTPSGGTPSYSYTWNPAQPNSGTATGLGANIYSTTVTDAFGCTATASNTISQPSALTTFTVSHNATSFGGNDGSARVTASGATPSYSYTWSTGATTDSIANLFAGTYYVTVCDANNCCKQDSVIISNPPPIILVFNNVQNQCFGQCIGSSSVSASGGISPYTFVWSNGTNGNVIAGLCAGTYTVTATDSAGVSVSSSTAINQPTQIVITLTPTEITCFGANNGSVSAIASGGTPSYSYNWNLGGNSNPISNLAPGTYTVTATDANNCTVQSSWVAVEPSQLTVSVSGITNVSCFGGADAGATANAAGGTPAYSYQWSNVTTNSNTAIGFSAGNQSVTVTDSRSCSATTSFTISQPTLLTVTVASTTSVSCNGGSNGAIDINTSGGTPTYNFAWSNGSIMEDLNGVAANSYSVVVTDSKNCTAGTNTVISEPTSISLSFNHTDPLCAGDINGTCQVTAIGGTPPFSYDWSYTASSNDNNSLQNIPAGVYTVSVYDNNQCVSIGNVTLTDPPSLNAQLINKTEISCANTQDGAIEVSVSGGTPPISYTWSHGPVTAIVNNLAPAVYTVTVSDNNACYSILNTIFVAPPAITIDFLSIDSASCPQYSDGAIQVSAIGGTPGSMIPYEYSTDGVNFQTSEFFLNLPSGLYPVRIRDSKGCLKDTTVFIGEPLKPTLSILPQDSMIDLGESITLTSSLTIYTGVDINFYSWSPVSGMNCGDCATVIATPYKQTEYNLTLNYLSNCTVSEKVTIQVGSGEDFFVPTAFTPNGDGNNDVFTIYGSGLAKVNMKIFNRWGEKVFDSTNQWLGWDGTYKGEVQNPGVYTYQINAVYLNGKQKERTGSITLVR